MGGDMVWFMEGDKVDLVIFFHIGLMEIELKSSFFQFYWITICGVYNLKDSFMKKSTK